MALYDDATTTGDTARARFWSEVLGQIVTSLA